MSKSRKDHGTVDVAQEEGTTLPAPDQPNEVEDTKEVATTNGRPKNAILQRLESGRGKGLNEAATSLDLSNPADRARAFNMCATQDILIKDEGEVVIEVVHYLVHEAWGQPDSKGEIKPFLRAAFLTTDNRVFATSSPVVLSRLAELLSFYDGMRLDGPVILKITETNNRKGTAKYHQLRIVPQEDIDDGKEELS